MAKMNELLFDGVLQFLFPGLPLAPQRFQLAVKFSPFRCLSHLLMNASELMCDRANFVLNSSHARQDGLFLTCKHLIGRATRTAATSPRGRERLATATDKACLISHNGHLFFRIYGNDLIITRAGVKGGPVKPVLDCSHCWGDVEEISIVR